MTAFVLGGFVLQSVRAWQLRRTNYAALCGSSRNLLVLLAASVPRDELAARRALGRWVSLALELAVLKPREWPRASNSRPFDRSPRAATF